MSRDSRDETQGIEPGDFVYLSLSGVNKELAAPRSLRENFAVLIGTGHASDDFEQTLVGQSIGDTGLIEISKGDTYGVTVPPTPIEDVVPDRIAPVLERAGISTAWDFLDTDPDDIAEEFVLDADRLSELQTATAEQLSDSRLVEYTISSAYRWRDLPDGTEGFESDDQQLTMAAPLQKAMPDEWRMFKRNSARTGSAGCYDAPKATRVAESWVQKRVKQVYGAAAVANGTVYISSQYGVFALDAVTGEEQWYREIENIKGSVVIADETVYVGSKQGIHALQPEDGDVIWTNDVNGAYSTPTVGNGILCIGINDGALEAPGYLYALDPATGEQRWIYEMDFAGSSIALGNETVYVGNQKRVYALDINNSENLWSKSSRGDFPKLAVKCDTIFISSKYGIYALNPASGETSWEYEVGYGFQTTPAVKNDSVYTGGSDGVYCLDAATGEKQWTEKTAGEIRSSPAVNNNTVFVGSQDGHLYGLDAETGERRWRHFIGSPVQASPTVVGRTVYIGGTGVGFFALQT